VLGTRAYLAGCGGFQRSVLSRLASEALGNLASPGSAMFEMLYEITCQLNAVDPAVLAGFFGKKKLLLEQL